MQLFTKVFILRPVSHPGEHGEWIMKSGNWGVKRGEGGMEGGDWEMESEGWTRLSESPGTQEQRSEAERIL